MSVESQIFNECHTYSAEINLNKISELLDNPLLDLNYQNPQYYNHGFLHRSSEHGFIDAVKLLLKKNPDVNRKTVYGDTPLHWACFKNHCDIAALLLSHGADHKLKNNSGWTHLPAACFYGHIELVKILLKNGADCTIEDNQHKDPIALCRDFRLKNQILELFELISLR